MAKYRKRTNRFSINPTTKRQAVTTTQDIKQPTILGEKDNSTEKNLLLGESSSGLSFVNILFATSLVVTTFLLSQEVESGLPIQSLFYLFLITFSSFYASIFYAVIAGSVARLETQAKEIERSMAYGNALSEYLGIYLLVILFPLVVWDFSGSVFASGLALGVNLAGYWLYKLSGFDMLERVIKNSYYRNFFGIFFSCLVIIHWIIKAGASMPLIGDHLSQQCSAMFWVGSCTNYYQLYISVTTTLLLLLLVVLHMQIQER